MSAPRDVGPLRRITRLVIATRNPGKLREFRSGLADVTDLELLTLEDFPEAPDVEETGDTYEDNARLKAINALKATGIPSLGDDSGLEVDFLDGAPGLKSARYAGPSAGAETRWKKLLEALVGVPPEGRTARFRCVLVLVESELVSSVETGIVPLPGDPMAPFDDPIPIRFTIVEGVVEGRILEAPRGTGGFGYDPVFEIAGDGRTMAELPAEEKNVVSHRGRALRRLKEILVTRG